MPGGGVGEVLSGAGSLLGAMGGGGGGGSSGGGVVVQGVSSDTAHEAGLWNSWAAQAAAKQAQQQSNNAINLIREQYGNAFQALKPYTTEGIQALNELNQYMGLKAYNPGTAPVKPELPSIESLMGKVSNAEAANYLVQNQQIRNKQVQFGGLTSSKDAKGRAWWTPEQSAQITDISKRAIADEQLKNMQATFDQQMNNYNQQMDVFNYAKQIQGEKEAEGIYTPEQVSEKLMNQPGVAFQYGQGLDALQRAASSKGMLGSGRLLQALADYGQGMASQQYGAQLDRLAALAGAGQQAAGQIAGAGQQSGLAGAQIFQGLGDTLANANLAAGNARSQGLLSANPVFKVIGGGGSSGGGMSGGFSGMFG